jgi:hypothetical protein
VLPTLLLEDRDGEEARAKSWGKQAKGSWLEGLSRPLSLRARSCQGISRAAAAPSTFDRTGHPLDLLDLLLSLACPYPTERL